MNCRQVRRRLSAFQDNELSPSEEQSVEKHLENCPECVDLYLDYEKVDQQLRNFPAPSEPADFTGQVMSEVRAASSRKKIRNFFRQGLLAATVLIGILLGTWLAINLNNRREQAAQASLQPPTIAVETSLAGGSSPIDPFSETPENTLSVRFARAEAGEVVSH